MKSPLRLLRDPRLPLGLRFRALIFFLGLAQAAFAQLPEPLTRGGIEGIPPPDGQTLAAILRSLVPEADSDWQGTLTIRRRGTPATSLPVAGRVVVGETNWSVTYATPGNAIIPAERVTVLCSTNAPNRYLRALAAKPGGDPGDLKPISVPEADTPFATSDFLLSDLGLEFLHWPRQSRPKGELRRDRPCHVLVSERDRATGQGYAKVVSWVDRSSGKPIEAEAYTADSRRPVKVFEIGSVTKVEGVWQLRDMEMVNRVTGSRSKIEFDLGEGK